MRITGTEHTVSLLFHLSMRCECTLRSNDSIHISTNFTTYDHQHSPHDGRDFTYMDELYDQFFLATGTGHADTLILKSVVVLAYPLNIYHCLCHCISISND